MIILDNVTVAIQGREILSSVSATVSAGDFIMIIGANGSGKTTLLDGIAGRIPISSGRVLFDGVDVSRSDERVRSRVVARLFQNPSVNIVPGLTVRQNLLLASKKGKSVGLSIPDWRLPTVILDRLAICGAGLEALMDKPMHSLSGGQRQMVALVMVTLEVPCILLLDEPTAALDPIAATQLLLFAKRLIAMHGVTVLMVTHDQRLAVTMGNGLWIISDGKIQNSYGNEKRMLVVDDLVGSIDYARLE